MIKTIGFVCFTVVLVGIAIDGVDAWGWGRNRNRDQGLDLSRQGGRGNSRFSFRTSARANNLESTPRCVGWKRGRNGACNSRQSANSWNRNSLKPNSYPNPNLNGRTSWRRYGETQESPVLAQSQVPSRTPWGRYGETQQSSILAQPPAESTGHNYGHTLSGAVVQGVSAGVISKGLSSGFGSRSREESEPQTQQAQLSTVFAQPSSIDYSARSLGSTSTQLGASGQGAQGVGTGTSNNPKGSRWGEQPQLKAPKVERIPKGQTCAATVNNIFAIQQSDIPGRGGPEDQATFPSFQTFFRRSCVAELETRRIFTNDVRSFDPAQDNNNPLTNPVTLGYYLPQQPPIGLGLPFGLAARLTQMCLRDDFGVGWEPQMVWMGARRNGTNGYTGPNDEMGHLLKATLCGPVAWYNLAPQSPRINRNSDNGGFANAWTNMEQYLAHYLQGNCGSVLWDLFVHYPTNDNNQIIQRRPDAFKVCVRLFDQQNRSVGQRHSVPVFIDNRL